MNNNAHTSQLNILLQENFASERDILPPLVTVDPTLELPQRLTKQRLPEFAAEIDACATERELDEWEGLASMKLLLQARGEARLLNELIAQVKATRRPGDAALILAEQLGRRIVPPARSDTWLKEDTHGGLLAFGVMAIAWMLRVVVFALIEWPLGDCNRSVVVTDLRHWSGAFMMIGHYKPTLISPFLLATAILWVLFEVYVTIPIAEQMRRKPLQKARLAENRSWRIDSMYLVYLLGSVLTCIGLCLRAWFQICRYVYIDGEVSGASGMTAFGLLCGTMWMMIAIVELHGRTISLSLK